jgi:SAM-dependent methyltransferase
MIEFVDPETHVPLFEEDGALYDSRSRRQVATIVDSIPRFVDPEENYAESFGWQWKRWRDTLSDSRSTGTAKRDLILERTHFGDYDIGGKTLLECGMGGGDDTEVLLTLPFSEVHAFDLSTAVERARQFLDDPRLVIFQASIYDIPYLDAAFDVVFCHRVLQHLPDPRRGLRAVCRKVKPGGLLFAHCYKRSFRYMMGYKYKYRWLTRRLSPERIHRFLDTWGPRFHAINRRLRTRRSLVPQAIAYSLIPFEWIPEYGDLDRDGLLELEKLVTFDALTPRYDRPMTSRTFRRIIESEGFRIEHIHDPRESPLYCTAVKL